MGKDVVVLGAGIVGVSAATHLRRRGWDVVVVDRQGPGDGPVTAKLCELATPYNSRILFKVSAPAFNKMGFFYMASPCCQPAKCQKMG